MRLGRHSEDAPPRQDNRRSEDPQEMTVPLSSTVESGAGLFARLMTSCLSSACHVLLKVLGEHRRSVNGELVVG